MHQLESRRAAHARFGRIPCAPQIWYAILKQQGRALALAGLGAVLVGCGGGGGGGGAASASPPLVPQTVTVSGIAAAGAALTGSVSVYDSSANTQPRIAGTSIDAAGQYSVVVTGFTAPFLLQATGQAGGQGPTVTLYSVATAAGTVNITPVTSLMALNMASGKIQTLMTGSLGTLPGLTATELDNQNTNVDTLLSAVLTQDGLSGNYNFSTTPFTVGGSGYSQLLNTVTLDLVTPAAVTITNNAAPGTPITIDTETGSPAGAFNVVDGPASLSVAVTIGGTVTGLTAAGLQLQNNAAETISVAANAITFTFATAIASGGAYAVTVKAQPSGQACVVSNGAGATASSNVSNVTVTCTATPIAPITYTFGGSVSNLKGVTLSLLLQNNGGFASNAVSVMPGQSTYSFGIGLPDGTGYTVTVQSQPSGQTCTATNGSGTLSGANVGTINVTCQTLAQWAWIGGDDSALNTVYGTLGQSAPANSPGGRSHAATSVDAAGNLWLFGGGYSDNSLANDLWVYNPNTGQWTWVAGSSQSKAAGVYGTKGVAGNGNVPGARYGAVSWTDTAGNFWLFGGQGYDSTGTQSWLNDLWKFSSATSQWMWVSGASLGNGSGVYGTAGVAAANNQPGARLQAFGWIDSANNLWLDGGAGINASGQQTTLNDLWKFDVVAGRWTWINGSQVGAVGGVYGTETVANSASSPGVRQSAATWSDSAGRLWMFGGYGMDASGTFDALSDLWRYSPASGLWTWMGGATGVDQLGAYGLQGVAAAGNLPGARFAATTWTDANGVFWLLGGEGYDSTDSASNIQNDIWKYDPTSGEWTWIAGANADGGGTPGHYQVQNLPADGNSPGARTSAMSWTDGSGIWLYGGVAASPLKPGASSYTLSQGANDLWHLGPAIFYNGIGSMSGTFTDQSGCQYSAVATIANANVTMSTASAGAVTVTYTVPTFTALASSPSSCPPYQAFNGSFAVPVSVNGTVMQSPAGLFGSVSATLIDGVVSGTVGFQETGAQGSGTFSWTESGRFSTPATSVTAPNLIGLTQAAAVAAINNAGFRVGTITHQNSDTVATGSIISQTPSANTATFSGSSLNIVLSTGPASETVPNVVGLNQAAADSAIIAAGLSLGSVTQQNDATIPSGSVISEAPAAGAKISTGSAITLVISRGPLLVAVPDVVGLSQSDATLAIKGAGLTVGNVTVQASTTAPSGSILSETPAANASVVSGTAVNLVASTVASPVSVPNVVGVGQATAVSAIMGAGLTVGTVTLQMSSTIPSGSVISETPSASSGVGSGGAVGLVISSGAQGIFLPVASPDVLGAGRSTTVTIHSTINIPNLVPGSVTVQLVNLAGSVQAILGQLNDLGTNNDSIAGDGVYSGTITLAPAASGRVWLQLSASQSGTPNLVVSEPIPVDVFPAGIPIAAYIADLTTPDTDPTTGAPTAPNEILACFSPAANPAAAVSVSASVGATVAGHISTVDNCYQLLLAPGGGGAAVRTAITTLKAQPLVLMVDPDFLTEDLGSPCNLPVCGEASYALLGFGTLSGTTNRAPIIALIDSGANFSDAALAPHLITNAPLFPQPSSDQQDTYGHGTAVAGILAGAAPLSKILVFKIGKDGPKAKDIGLIGEAIESARQQGAKIINLSLGLPKGITDLIGPDAMESVTQIIRTAEKSGIILVAAAGNNFENTPIYPASLSVTEPRVISVSAVNDSGMDATGSSSPARDIAGTWQAPQIPQLEGTALNASIAAPGVLVETNALTDGVPTTFTGTSASVPFVAATVALVESQYPTMDPTEVKKQVLSSAAPILYLNSSFGIIDQHLVNPTEKGQGRLDPVAALGAIRFTQRGFNDENELDVTIGTPTQNLVNVPPVILGTVKAVTGDPCEARLSNPCTYDFPMTPLPPGQYQINISLPDDSDFGGDFAVTVPGMTIVNCLTAATGSVVDPQHGSFFLVGANGNQRFAIFTLQQDPL